MWKSEDARIGVGQADPGRVGYQALADFERWAALGAGAPGFAERLAVAGCAAAAHRRLAEGELPSDPDPLLDEAESRVRPGDWWESLTRAYHWQRLTAQAYGVELDPQPQEWAGECLDAACEGDQALADRLALIERRLAGEALVLRHTLGRL
ncbi:hypothetical protein KDL01_31960 [Actinospica durhamensis]|uniref:Uncharacterized protein n=1 Tax=Actinospica durhamensis TaxID=1508375 RepID=A0A941EVA6_9ACTN|nr:hypothetical protein [Actinospica durhamensis]MBR7837931.1 hypothetical protein [Actinospica durhamensis]